MRTLTVTMLAVLLLAGCTAGNETAAPATRAEPARSEAPATPEPPLDVLDVTCTSSGTKVAKRTIAAQPDGVHIRATNETADKGTFLAYFYPDRRGGGDRIEPNPKTWVAAFPPGRGTVACHHQNSTVKDPPVEIEVTDTAGVWRTGGLAELGCRPPDQSIIDWVHGPGVGDTPDAALSDLARQTKKQLTWRHVQEGYVDSVSQSYVIYEKLPWVSATVLRVPGPRYYAHLGDRCA